MVKYIVLNTYNKIEVELNIPQGGIVVTSNIAHTIAKIQSYGKHVYTIFS